MTLEDDLNRIEDEWARRLITGNVRDLYHTDLSGQILKDWLALNKKRGKEYPEIEKVVKERYSILGRIKFRIGYY